MFFKSTPINLKYTAHPQTGEIQILEDTHYYPFACPLRSIRGLQHQGYQPNHKIIGFDGPGGNVTIIPTMPNVRDLYKYKYNGKELQDEMGLDWYVPIAIGNGTRMYMQDIGRWGVPDPYMELMRKHSPYSYGFNNPVYFADYNGGIPWPIPEMFKKLGKKETT